MTKRDQNFSMFAGDTKIISVTLSDIPLGLGGASIKWGLKRSAFSNNTPVLKTTGDTITITGANTFTIKLLPSDTQGLVGEFYHECEVTDAVGDITTVFIGAATIERSGI